MTKATLKTKMALAVSGLFILFGTILGGFTLSYFQHEYKRSLTEQQFSLTSSIAREIDDKLRLALKSLVAATPFVPPAGFTDAEEAQRFLDSKSTLHVIFDNGIFLISPAGLLIAESPYRPARRGRDISFRDYFKTTIKNGKPFISDPYTSTHTPGHPAIMFTVPIFGRDGKLAGILAGSVDLLGDNFLGKLSRFKIGETGYMSLTNGKRTLIMHPDKSRLMQDDIMPGKNPLYDEALKGKDVNGETFSSKGVPNISSFKHLQATDWIVGASYPLKEAYAPLRKATYLFIVAISIGIFCILVATWFLMQLVTAPLHKFTNHVEQLSLTLDNPKPISIDSGDEIGLLATAYNRLMANLDLHRQALAEREANFRAVAENAQTGIIIVDGSGSFLYANPRAGEITGYSLPALLAMDFAQLAPPSESGLLYERLEKRLADEPVPRHYESALCRRDGGIIPIELTGARTVWQGKPADLIIFRDITEQKEEEWRKEQLKEELEIRVQERTLELQTSNREMESFCYSISHDLRTPLRSMAGFSGILLEEYAPALDSTARGYLTKISASASRMGKLIDDLLALARVTRTDICHEEVDLSGMVRDVMNELTGREPDRIINCTVSEERSCHGDPRLLRIAIENLLSNALKFSGKETGPTEIEFGAITRGDGKCAYFIRDNGAGFDMRYAHKLFEPFQRLHGIDEFEGTGIGLATVRRIIERQGGTIWAESEVGHGATFIFTLA